MTYELNITIQNPTHKEHTNKLHLVASFAHDPNQYGNGYSLNIKGENGFDLYYDLRYDKDFSKITKEEWLLTWAKYYWSGEHGSYKLTQFQIVWAD